MPTKNHDNLLTPGRKAIITFDPFHGRAGKDLTGTLVEVTSYGGFDQVGVQVLGYKHGSMAVSDYTLIACDDNGRPLPEEVERCYRALDHEQKLLDDKRDKLTELLSGTLGR